MPNARRILIVDDDTELRDALVEQLSLHEEFEAVPADSGTKGVQAAKAGQIDLVIMDVGLPDIDGREAVRILRKNGFKAPIIMLTGHDTDSDTILGLESGANDYVAKPFRFAVLLARIRAQLRQHEASEDAIFTIGPYTFQPSSKLLVGPKGNKVRLTEKETAILRFLYRAGLRPISREVLLAGGVGLQLRRDHPHAGNPHLSPAPEDREGRRLSRNSGDRGRRLQAGALTAMGPGPAMEVWSMVGFDGIVMAGLDPAIPLREAPPCHMIGIAGSSPAMTAGGPISSEQAPVVRVLRHEP